MMLKHTIAIHKTIPFWGEGDEPKREELIKYSTFVPTSARRKQHTNLQLSNDENHFGVGKISSNFHKLASYIINLIITSSGKREERNNARSILLQFHKNSHPKQEHGDDFREEYHNSTWGNRHTHPTKTTNLGGYEISFPSFHPSLFSSFLHNQSIHGHI